MRKLRECRRIRGDRNDDLMSLASERELFAQDTLTGDVSQRGILFYQDGGYIFMCFNLLQHYVQLNYYIS